MEYYKISHPSTGKVVNLYSTDSTSPVTDGTRLLLYSWQNNSDQKWGLEPVGDLALLHLKRAEKKVMNRHSINNNAIVWEYDGAEDTKKDSLINTETENGNMRIKLVYRNLYLTKNSGDNYLCWASKMYDDRQYFTLQQVDANTGGGSTGSGTGGWNGSRHYQATISVSGQNQYGAPYSNYSKTFQSNACYIASLISAAHGLGRTASLAIAMNEGCVVDEYRTISGTTYQPGYVYSTPSFISIVKNQTYSLANIYTQIKEKKRPVIVYGYNSSRKSGHYVVAYYTSASSSSSITTDNTYVMDPWQGWVTLQTFLNEYPNTLHLRYCS